MTARTFAERGPWLFGPGTDLAVFGGSALLSFVLVAVGAHLDLLDADAPAWVFVACVLAVDVAHVWSTVFRVYFDATEVQSRPLLYLGVPALLFGLGVCLHAVSALAFWRALAYVAVFHFVRQQIGWLSLYGRRNVAETRLDTLLDRATVYTLTVAPVVHWHAHLPRRFAWFLQGDFVGGLDPRVGDAALIAQWTLLGAFVLRQAVLLRRGTAVVGKWLVVLATFSCWYVGIVVFDSDYVFTVTNVLIHGLPYMLLTYRYASASPRASLAQKLAVRGAWAFLLTCLALAFGEELLWDRWVFGDYPELFGAAVTQPDEVLVWLVPLLALPQMTHYVLDGFVWRVRSENPVLRRELEAP